MLFRTRVSADIFSFGLLFGYLEIATDVQSVVFVIDKWLDTFLWNKKSKWVFVALKVEVNGTRSDHGLFGQYWYNIESIYGSITKKVLPRFRVSTQVFGTQTPE